VTDESADIEYSISPIGNYASGGAVIEFRDVTEQKKMERERLNAILMTEQQSGAQAATNYKNTLSLHDTVRIQADQVHKANMTSFVSFVCHELRNPLQGVTSSAVCQGSFQQCCLLITKQEFLLDTLQKLDELTRQLSIVKGGTLSPEHTQAGFEKVALGSPSNNNCNDKGRHLPSLKPNTAVLNSHKVVEMEGLISYAKQLVGNIQTCAEHQGLITNNVLDLTKLDSGKVEPMLDVVDVQALGQQTVAMMSSKAQRKQINISMSQESNQPLYLKADATILRQVLLNLISNAINVRRSCYLTELELTDHLVYSRARKGNYRPIYRPSK
jgi:signal transduction histidine kinase